MEDIRLVMIQTEETYNTYLYTPKYSVCPNTGVDSDDYIPTLRIYVKKMLTRNKHTFGYGDTEQTIMNTE